MKLSGNSFESLKQQVLQKPILFILLLGFAINLVAVFFSKGYAMHDDHFGPIEQPWSIINNPKIWEERSEPHAHSILYPLLHFILFKSLNSIGINDPQEIMFIVRFLHSIYSLVTLVFLFKILQHYYPQDVALKTTIVFSLLWFIPFMSVRNLIEVVCIPPMAVAFWLIITKGNTKSSYFVAGAFFALAFAFRYQTVLVSGTVLLVLLFQRKFRDLFLISIGFVIFAFVIQGSVDVFAWGYPFASFIEYLRYNLTHSTEYTTGPFYRYILLLFGAFVPPISVFVLYYFFKDFRQKIIILFPLLVFFIFHSIFPNKQERFILPVVPFVFIFGLATWLKNVNGSRFWGNHKTFYKVLWIIFWCINIPLLSIFTLNYGKKTRCESLYFLSKKDNVKGVFQITGKLGPFKPPEFYLNKYGTPIIEIPVIDSLVKFGNSPQRPNYAIIYGESDMEELRSESEKILRAKLIKETTVEPSIADYILFKLNPKYNKNQTATIFRIE
jgi:hypothetical protein